MDIIRQADRVAWPGDSVAWALCAYATLLQQQSDVLGMSVISRHAAMPGDRRARTSTLAKIHRFVDEFSLYVDNITTLV